MKKLSALAILVVAGCQLETPQLATVSSNPFGLQAESRVAKASYEPADEGLSVRVDSVGRKVLAANPQIGLRPVYFATVGKAASPEVFHVGLNTVYVTDGLVQRCKNEGELAAVLALEMGKMVAQREAAASPDMRNPDRLPPIQVPIGNSGQFTNPDLVHQIELAKYEKVRPKTQKKLSQPHAEGLAREYLEKAGFLSADLDAVQPLLQDAQNNITLERQFKGISAPNTWSP